MVRSLRQASWDRGGGEAAETPQTIANKTLSIPDPSPVPTLSTSLVVAGGAGAGGVGHSQKEEADAKAPACLSNSALHRLSGTDSPDEPIVLPSPLPAT
jgi:hypothetical protein